MRSLIIIRIQSVSRAINKMYLRAKHLIKKRATIDGSLYRKIWRGVLLKHDHFHGLREISGFELIEIGA
jgi:hypothetical protein